MLVTKVVSSGYYEVKGSKFLSFLIPISDFRKFVDECKIEHPKAVHFVTASRFLNLERQIEESFSDDGEPRGTSGMPMLKVMRGYDLIECGVLSIRYFGGTLLGTGGLVKAYTQSAKEAILNAINESNLQEYIKNDTMEMFIPFSKIKLFEYLIEKHNILVVNREFKEKGVFVLVESQANVLKLLRQSV